MAKKRGANEGTITRLADGRWQARLNLGSVNGKRNRKPYYGKTRKEAADKLVAAQRDLQQGLPIASDRLTVGQFLTTWLAETVKPNKAPKTYRSYEQNVRLYLIPALGRRQVTKLTPQQVQAFLNAKRAAGYAPETVERMRDVLRNALNQAVTWGQAPRNVAALVKVPRGEHQEKRALDPIQARIFLDAAQGDRLEALYGVAVALGMRQGEILGLRWADVDLEGRKLQVRGQIQRIEGQFRRVDTKSAASRREIVLPLSLVKILKAHKKRQNEARLLAGRDWQDHNLVFCTKWGKPFDGGNITRYCQRLLRDAGLPRLTFHELRHSCASLLAAQGLPAHEIARLLGHADVRLTINTYMHQFAEAQQRAADAMNNLFGDGEAVANAD